MHDLALRVTNQPNLQELKNVAAEIQASPKFGVTSAESLEIYTAILQSQLLLTFANNANDIFRDLFSNPVGLGCLVSRLNSGMAAEVSVLVNLLETILQQPGIVMKLLGMDDMETSNLLYGSRVLAAVSAKPSVNSWLGDVNAYSKWLSSQSIDLQVNSTNRAFNYTKLFERGIKLGAPQIYISDYLHNKQLLNSIWQGLRPAQQRFVLVHALIPVLPQTVGQRSRLLADIGVDASLFVDVCMRLPGDVQLVRTAVVLAKHQHVLSSTIESVGTEWASKASVVGRPLAQQQCMTQFLIAACASLDESNVKQFAHSSVLSAGVANHLESTSASIRNLGTLVAECFAKQAGAKLEFGIKYEDYDWWIGVDTMDEKYDANSESTANDVRADTKEYKGPLAAVLNPATPDSDDEDVFDDEESEEEVAPLFYIKDLLEYLTSDKYSEVHCALTTGAALINRKSGFGSEVAHYSEELLRRACGLSDKYSLTDFAQLRQSILNAVVIAVPEKAAPEVVKLFVTGDWSLAQRQCLLASLVYASHTLAEGNQAQGNHISAKNENVKRLPPALHNLFITQQDTKMIESQLNGLELQSSKSTAVKNQFSEVSSRFFFPLLAAQPPLRASSYDAIIYAQWLRTLSVIVAEAYPSRHMPGMVDEIWPLLKAIIVSNRLEVVILEAAYSSLIMIISVASGIILQNYPNDIGTLTDAAVQNLGRPGMEAVKSNQPALSALASLAKEVEKRVFGSAEFQ